MAMTFAKSIYMVKYGGGVHSADDQDLETTTPDNTKLLSHDILHGCASTSENISEDYSFSRESVYVHPLQETNCSFICVLAKTSVKKID